MVTYTRKIEPLPSSFVKDGRPVFGTFAGRPDRLDIRGVKNPYSVFHFLPVWITNLRIKSRLSVFFCLGKYIGSIDFFDAKLLGFSDVNFWDTESGRRFVYRSLMGPRKRFVPHDLNCGFCLNHRRRRYLRISWDKSHRKFSVLFELAGNSVMPSANAAFLGRTESPDRAFFTVCTPYPTTRRCSAHHMESLPVHGAVTVREKGRDIKVMDDTEGISFFDMSRYYMKFHSSGEYLTGLGSVNGRPVTFRLDISTQQPVDSYTYNANVLFYAGKPTPLPPVRITHSRGFMQPWNIQDTEGMVDLRFTPVSDSPNVISSLLLRAEYHTIYGTFEGALITSDGDKVSFKSIGGIAKKYRIRL